MGCRYTRPVYSKETYEYWGECERKSKEFAERHSKETEKCYKVNNLYIWCIQRKYDACMNKENEYGIQVWTREDRNIFEGAECLVNEWYDTPDEANKSFLVWKGQCEIG